MAAGLLVLHGFTGSPASWDPALTALRGRTRVLAPPLVGHGAAANVNVAEFEAEVARIAALAGGARWHLAGYSLGGRIAIGLLCAHPELFSSATLIGAQPGLESESDRAERRTADERWCAILRDRGIGEFATRWEEQPLFASQAALSAEMRQAQRSERLAHTAEGLVRSLETTGLGRMPSYWDKLPTILVPVTLVVGSTDEKFLSIARSMARSIPHARLEIVPGVGHNVLLEEPRVIGRILEEAFTVERSP